MGRVSIDTQQCEIKKIFSDEFVFTIPRYQRPYAWTTEEAGMLLEDLLDAIGDSTQDIEEVPRYFLGSIVLAKGEKPLSACSERGVGQLHIFHLNIASTQSVHLRLHVFAAHAIM